MNLIGMKKEYPNIPEDIKTMIREEVDAQIKKKEIKFIRRKRGIKIAVAVMSVVILTGGTIYAIKKAHSVSVEDKGDYAEEVVIGDNSDEEYIIPTLTFEGTYVGEGMTFKDVGTSKIRYGSEKGNESYMSMFFESIPQGDGANSLVTSVENYEQIDINGNIGYVFYKDNYDDEGVQYEIIVVYDEFHYMMRMLVFDDMEIEEAIKVAEGIVLTPTDNLEAENLVIDERPPFDQMESQQPTDIFYESDYPMSIPKEDLTIYEMNEPFVTNISNIDTREIQLKVNVQVCDDLSLLNKDIVDEWYSSLYDLLGDDGKIHNASVDYVVLGDGINTVDEAIYSEKVPVKLVYVEVEYTNIGNNVITNTIYDASIHFMDEKEDEFEVYTGLEDKCEKKYDYIDTRISHHLHSSNLYHYNGRDFWEKNYLVDLQPGESQTVQWAYLVAEDMLPYMYFDFKADTITFNSSKYVDIRQ